MPMEEGLASSEQMGCSWTHAFTGARMCCLAHQAVPAGHHTHGALHPSTHTPYRFKGKVGVRHLDHARPAERSDGGLG